MKHVVIVESPAKADTINKYLGKDFVVMASYGHIRDLPPKNGSVDPDQNFRMLWQIDSKDQKRIDEITKVVKQASSLILATDPDREGEAISWHVYEVLKEAGVLDSVPIKRVVFNEITKNAILNAMENPRDIDHALVNAYMARRALDYLVGFTLSPVLWRKLPGSRSAGRVQSVALRLICDREEEIEVFKPQEYWSVDTQFETSSGKPFQAHLIAFRGTKLDRLSLSNQDQAFDAVKCIESNPFTVRSIENKTVNRHPQPPFITSTLQQEASRKLGFTVTRTMQVAQRLYEGINLGGETVGLITYMRTDGVTLSHEAVSAMRTHLKKYYGDSYVPEHPRIYKSKSKNAQEAHEAIRPTDINRRPDAVRSFLSEEQFKLYELIWKRALASQTASAILDQMTVDITPPDNQDVVLRATGSVIVFDGFYRLYQEGNEIHGSDDAEDETEDERRLPKMTEGESLKRLDILPEQHFTKPPPRYTEASLVRKMEELGIGRPSTYASIIRILKDRNYVQLENRRFIPEDRGRLVTTFLKNFFEKYVQYNFTADLEEQLDSISANQLNLLTVLKEFWEPFQEAVTGTKDLTITEVLDTLNQALSEHFFPTEEGIADPRQCRSCDTGQLGLRLGRYGAFIGCSNYPTCRYTRQLKLGDGDDGQQEETLTSGGPLTLGVDPDTGKNVLLCKGPYGFYVQLGETEEEATDPVTTKDDTSTSKRKSKKTKKNAKLKPKRSALPKGLSPADVDLEKALALLSLPRELGVHPETGEPITTAIGRFGPYVKMGSLFVSLKKEDDVLTVALERAVELISQSGKKAIQLGEYKKKPVTVHKGRFGYYIKCGKLNTAVPKGMEPDALTLEQATAIIESKLAKEETSKSDQKPKKATSKPLAKTGKPKSAAKKKKAASKA